MRLAEKVGFENAGFLQDIYFWMGYNKSSNTCFFNDRYWTFSTQEELCARHPYWTRKQIQRIIKNCKDSGWLLVDNYNKNPYDRTNWYSLSNEIIDLIQGNSNYEIGTIDCPKTVTVQSPKQGNDINEEDSLMNSDNKNYIPPTPQRERKSRRKKCDVPTLDDVIEYATSRGRKDLAQGFFEYYNEGNWCDSKGNPVLNWKQKFITWVQRNPKPKENTSGGEKIYF